MNIDIGFLAAALALAGSPGPNTLSLAAVGATFGWRRGIVYMLGLNLGMLVVIAIVGSGTAALLFVVPGAIAVVSIAAAAYFLYLAYRIATAPPLSTGARPDRPPSWIAAALVSLANPKAYAAMAAMFSGFTLTSDHLADDALVKSGLLLAVVVAVNIIWLRIGTALTPLLTTPATSRVVNVSFAAALLLSVALAVIL